MCVSHCFCHHCNTAYSSLFLRSVTRKCENLDFIKILVFCVFGPVQTYLHQLLAKSVEHMIVLDFFVYCGIEI